LPALLAAADEFISHHICLLDVSPDGPTNLWHWLTLADAAGLDELAAQLASRAVQLDRGLCADEMRLRGLSARTLSAMCVALAAAPASGGGSGTSQSGKQPNGNDARRRGYRLYNSPELASILDLDAP
jgi:hypothetical protein